LHEFGHKQSKGKYWKKVSFKKKIHDKKRKSMFFSLKEFGIGVVVAKQSTHYGMAGFYSIKALKENLIVNFLNFSYYIHTLLLTNMSFLGANTFDNNG
jgi:LDH2 family malate/lactate/ureidoglycolate dehydrogenase